MAKPEKDHDKAQRETFKTFIEIEGEIENP
jgi:hypothetical protein